MKTMLRVWRMPAGFALSILAALLAMLLADSEAVRLLAWMVLAAPLLLCLTLLTPWS